MWTERSPGVGMTWGVFPSGEGCSFCLSRKLGPLGSCFGRSDSTDCLSDVRCFIIYSFIQLMVWSSPQVPGAVSSSDNKLENRPQSLPSGGLHVRRGDKHVSTWIYKDRQWLMLRRMEGR